MPINDNDAAAVATASPTDPHGHAALILVESLIHGLCERGALSTEEAVAITERAINVQAEFAEAADGAGAPLWHSHALLTAIAASLKIDSSNKPAPPHLVT